MKKITITIKNGKVTTEASGYKGGACEAPIQHALDALGGKISKNSVTEEGLLTEDPIVNESNDELTA
jgi:hypothetical protein